MNVTAIDRAADRQTLCLTLNRSSQQGSKRYIKDKKMDLRNKPFTMFSKPPKFCKKHASVLLNMQKGVVNSVTFLKLGCNSWRCPICAPIKARYVSNLMRGIIILNDMKYTLCLTLDPKIIPEKYNGRTQKYITDLLNILFTELRREYKDQILKYEWAIEFQHLNTDDAHVHIATNLRPDIVKVRKIWKRIGGGPQMRVDPIRNIISASNYISKYILKSVTDISISRMYHFEKRYAISRSCIRPKKSTKEFCPTLSNIEKQAKMQQMGLRAVYNMLINKQFIDGEELSTHNLPL